MLKWLHDILWGLYEAHLDKFQNKYSLPPYIDGVAVLCFAGKIAVHIVVILKNQVNIYGLREAWRFCKSLWDYEKHDDDEMFVFQ